METPKLTTTIRFGIDRNNDKMIAQNEHAEFEEMKTLDSNGDNFLKGEELDSVYYEYGKERWLQAGRTHRLPEPNSTTFVKLNQISFEPANFEMKVDVRYGRPNS